MTATNNVSALAVISGLVPSDASKLFRTIEQINEGEASLISLMKAMKPHLEGLGSEVNTVPRLAKLQSIINLIEEHDSWVADESMKVAKAKEKEPIDWSINELNLTVRATNVLRDAQIFLVKDLVKMSENNLIKTPNLGRRSLDDIKETLAAYGLTLGTRDFKGIRDFK